MQKTTLISRLFTGLVVGTLAVAGCGNSGGSMEGTISGNSLSINGVHFQKPSTGSSVVVLASDQTNLCELANVSKTPKDAEELQMQFANSDASPVAAGTYQVVADLTGGTGARVVVGFTKIVSCSEQTKVQAQSGTVTISKIDAANVEATFDITFPSGDHVTGSLHGPVCEPLTSDGGSIPANAC
jgi:hypothetical protein